MNELTLWCIIAGLALLALGLIYKIANLMLSSKKMKQDLEDTRAEIAYLYNMNSNINVFSRHHFESVDMSERQHLCQELQAILKTILGKKDNFAAEIMAIIKYLRLLGHDLWSYDEDEDRQVWGRDYTKKNPPGLLIEFYRPDEVNVTWDIK